MVLVELQFWWCWWSCNAGGDVMLVVIVEVLVNSGAVALGCY